MTGREPGRGAGDDPLLAAAWALDAVDDDERAAYERRLREHPEERADADALREAASHLADGEPPPERLRAAVLAAVAATAQERPHGTAPVVDPVVDLAAARDRRAGRRAERRRGPSRWSVLVAAAGVAVAAVGVGTGIGLAQREQAPVLSAEQLARQQVTDLLAVPGATVATLTTTAGGTATLVRADGRLGVVAAGLPAAGAGKGYQVWLGTGDHFDSVGMMDLSGDGGTAMVLDPGPATALGITVEPAGGSPQPTTTPVLLAPLTA
ncbi:anti-sigma factor [Kineococcus sp. SYSU DK002]|uniref:anti-sigma factor n=1 Tax=Kineococcus sp. SYSU DK002 TaxID=3383123 RepID=UPI003D7D27B9